MATSRTGLGFPAIDTPNLLELRGVAKAISNTRQRMEAVESAVTALRSTATGANSATAGQIDALAKQLTLLAQAVVNLGNAATIDTAPYVAGEPLVLGQGVVSLGGQQVGIADASDPLRMFGLIGIATGSAPTGSTVVVQRRGPFTVVGANFETGRAVYVTDGGLTQTPDYEATALPVGVAVSSTVVFVAPDWPALRGPPIGSAVGDAYLRYLPVTYSLIADALELLDVLALQAPGLAIWTGVELVTDPTTLPVLPSGGLDGTEIVVVERDGIAVQTTVREFALYTIKLLTVSG